MTGDRFSCRLAVCRFSTQSEESCKIVQHQGDPVALLEQADVVFREVLGNVTPDQMDLPTVNDEWDVRTLINHVVLGNAWAAENVRTGNAPRPSGDIIGDRNPVDAYTASADDMIAAFR